MATAKKNKIKRLIKKIIIPCWLLYHECKFNYWIYSGYVKLIYEMQQLHIIACTNLDMHETN